jgi:hypothetical protein
MNIRNYQANIVNLFGYLIWTPCAAGPFAFSPHKMGNLGAKNGKCLSAY